MRGRRTKAQIRITAAAALTLLAVLLEGPEPLAAQNADTRAIGDVVALADPPTRLTHSPAPDRRAAAPVDPFASVTPIRPEIHLGEVPIGSSVSRVELSETAPMARIAPAQVRNRAGVPWIIAGSALIVGGAIVGDDVGTVLMVGGIGVTAYGLYIYF